MRTKVLGFAVAALGAAAALGAGVALRNDGLEFPDGTVQTTAPILPAASAVQGSGQADIPPLAFCSGNHTLYTVPAGKRLAIEWVSVRISVPMGGLADPVEVRMTTRSGATPILHPLARLRDSEVVLGSFFASQIWNSPVRLYSDPGHDVEISACRDGDPDEFHNVTVTFSGHLVDAT